MHRSIPAPHHCRAVLKRDDTIMHAPKSKQAAGGAARSRVSIASPPARVLGCGVWQGHHAARLAVLDFGLLRFAVACLAVLPIGAKHVFRGGGGG